jgi:predicted lysophospholipase L1 biosynthesis ABC-type transport system permease subunit
VVAWQAATVAVASLVFAVPLGIVAGRIVWHLFAVRLGVVPEAATPAVPLALVAPAAILLAVGVSIGPALAAARTRPASVLRQE